MLGYCTPQALPKLESDVDEDEDAFPSLRSPSVLPHGEIAPCLHACARLKAVGIDYGSADSAWEWHTHLHHTSASLSTVKGIVLQTHTCLCSMCGCIQHALCK